jgi:hypothetical protein
VLVLTQIGAVIGCVADHALRWLHFADQSLRNWTVMRFASG